jgi:hypothetical protein
MRNEEQEDGAQDRILDKEIESWKGFEYALREENSSLLFNKMLTKCQGNEEYSEATAARGEPYSAESLFMAYISAPKMIRDLMERLVKSKV